MKKKWYEYTDKASDEVFTVDTIERIKDGFMWDEKPWTRRFHNIMDSLKIYNPKRHKIEKFLRRFF